MAKQDPTLCLMIDSQKRARFISAKMPAYHRNIDTLCQIMGDFYRQQSIAWESEFRQEQHLHNHTKRKYDVMKRDYNNTFDEHNLMYQVLHQIFEEHPHLRYEYGLMIQFEDLPDEEFVEEITVPVRRRLNFE